MISSFLRLFKGHRFQFIRPFRFVPILICCALVGFTNATAQKLKIIDANTGLPISNVAVYTPDKSFSVVSDSSGNASIAGLSKKFDQLLFQHTAYQNETYSLSDLKANQYRVLLLEQIVMLDDMVVSVNRKEEGTQNVSNEVAIISQKAIQLSNPQTSADLLEKSGRVYIQKSQMGGGSPILRGFEANKVLIVVDGVRMNNAIYRGGHLQNVITVNPSFVDRAEVVFGPGSLIYGSDALGGVMHFITKSPELTNGDELGISTNYLARYGSVNQEKTGYLDFSISGKKFGSITNIGYTDFDDQKAGTKRNDFYGDWGLTPNYVERIQGIDSITANSDSNVQRFSGYSQLDLGQKFLIRPNYQLELGVNFQFSQSSNIPRYDKLQELTGDEEFRRFTMEVAPDSFVSYDSLVQFDRLKFAEWYYGPQSRFFSSLYIQDTKARKIYDFSKITFACQRIKEERVNRKYRDPEKTYRLETVDALSVNADFEKKLGETFTNRIKYGIELVYNYVKSEARTLNIETNELSAASTRYPDGGSKYLTSAAYVKSLNELSSKVHLNGGLRFSSIQLNSTFSDRAAFDFEFDQISISTTALSGSLELLYKPTTQWKTNLIYSSGFRAPNVDDVGKVFDPSPGEVVIPNANLKPEYSYNFEATIERKIQQAVKVSATGYFSLLRDMISRAAFSFEGADTLVFDGTPSQVLANVNIGKAFITGISLNLIANVHRHINISSSLSYTKGRDTETDEPLAHIPPIYGKTALNFKKNKFNSSFNLRYQGWKALKDYSPSSSDNLDEATEFGTPAWFTMNMHMSYSVFKQLELQFGIENILDRHYRPFASGISAPGRNFLIAVRGQF